MAMKRKRKKDEFGERSDPFERLFPDDLENEPSLKWVSDSAWKLWVRMFLYMGCKSPRRGYLLKLNGEAPTEDELAALFGIDSHRFASLLHDLESNKVFSRDAGVIVCRRQAREANSDANPEKTRSEINSENAIKRWYPEMQKPKTGCESDANRNANRNANPVLKLMQIASPSGSGSGSDQEGVQREEPAHDVWSGAVAGDGDAQEQLQLLRNKGVVEARKVIASLTGGFRLKKDDPAERRSRARLGVRYAHRRQLLLRFNLDRERVVQLHLPFCPTSVRGDTWS